MFEPVFEHNRKKFERFHRHQIFTVVGVVAGALLIAVVVVLVGDSGWVEWAAYSVLIAAFLVLGVLEIMKTLVFRRDLHEQRDFGQGADKRAPPD